MSADLDELAAMEQPSVQDARRFFSHEYFNPLWLIAEYGRSILSFHRLAEAARVFALIEYSAEREDLHAALHGAIGLNERTAVQQRDEFYVAVPMDVILSHGSSGQLTVAGDVLDRRSFENPMAAGRFAHLFDDCCPGAYQTIIQALLRVVPASLIVC
jgi:hypothetical protein